MKLDNSQLDDLFGSLKDLTDKFALIKQKLAEETKATVVPTIQKFLGLVPEYHSVTWTQYTPYFNDGDACYFRVNEPSAILEGEDEEEDSLYRFNRPSEYIYRDRTKYDYCEKAITEYEGYVASMGQDRIDDIKKIVDRFTTWFNKLDSDSMEMAFGNHVRVTVTREGVDIAEIDHD